jgi:membrane protein required for colicin V production
MIALDIVILSVLCVGFVIGFVKGIIKQAFSLGGLILGIVFGTLLYRPFAGLLLNIFRMSDQTARIVAFVIILLIVPIVCGVVGKILSKVVRAANLGFVDRIAGAFFGLLKYILVMGLVIMIFEMTGVSDHIMNSAEKKQSKLYAPVRSISSFCLHWTWNKVLKNTEDLIQDSPMTEPQTV